MPTLALLASGRTYMVTGASHGQCSRGGSHGRPAASSVRALDNSKDHAGVDDTQQLRLQLGSQFPNAILLPGSQLPPLYSSKHFLSLTNGLAFAVLCQQLSLPFSVVRIRSTALEQQLLEALMLELDSGLVLPLALGHSCIVWDAGSRNRNNGAPRAVWYGLEFIRFCLHRSWLGSGGAAHLRGIDVSRDFERACRGFQQSTKKRLAYYKRYLAPSVQQQGVQLAGIFQHTDRDEDVAYFVEQARQHCGPAAAASSSSSSSSSLTCSSQGQLSPQDVGAYQVLAAAGCGLFTAGLSHTQYRQLQATGVIGHEGKLAG